MRVARLRATRNPRIPCSFLWLLAATVLSAQTQPTNFHLAVVDGEGALNSIQGHLARDPVVQVKDSDRKPVAGAYVEFDAPSSGASAIFANGSTHFSAITNSDGLAVGSGMRNNGVAGAFVILVHVSYQGQAIGELSIHQTNLSKRVARLSNDLGGSTVGAPVSTLPPSVLGVVLGEEFLLNGVSTPSNANLLQGARIQTNAKPATLYLHDQCEYLVGARSAVTISPRTITLESGSVRARRFGNCRIGYGGFWIQGSDPSSDGVVALSANTLEVAALTGNVQVLSAAGQVLNTIPAGTVSTYNTAAAVSGASAGTPTPLKQKVLVDTAFAASLAALGLAADALVTSSATSP